MARRSLRAWLFVSTLAVSTAAAPEDRAGGPEPELPALKAHVAALASPEFRGRRGEGGRMAVDYLVEAFRGLGLEPLFDGRFTQDIPDRESGQVLGRNVGAKLVGSDPKLGDEWVIVSAHYDHLGVRHGVLYPGADDNASGVAMLLEVARCLARAPEKPRRSIMLLGFDMEEVGLWGSRYFAGHCPVPMDRVSLFVTADMISRSLGGVCDPYVFVFGSEYAPGLRPWIAGASAGRDLEVGLLGADIIDTVGYRSDYGPFKARSVPFLFFSTGENPKYHTPDDTPDTLDYPKMTAISRLILGIVRRASAAEVVPRWAAAPEYAASETATIRDVIRILLDHRDELKIGPSKALLMRNTLRSLDGIVARGTITPGERSRLVNVARIILLSVL